MQKSGMVLRLTRGVALGMGVLLLIAQLVRPEKSNPSLDPARAMSAHTQFTPEVADVFRRACNDCHSNQTVWPWYSHVAPVSWFVIDHVNHGRSHLNFSDWARYRAEEADDLLGSIAEEVRDGEMPLTSYTLLHPEAKITQDERTMIIEWAQAERARLAYRRK